MRNLSEEQRELGWKKRELVTGKSDKNKWLTADKTHLF
jgi:hypothetical protein